MLKAVVGLLQRENKILIAERPAHKPYSGYWEFPGGKIENDETGEQALMRELHEELGIKVITARFLFPHEHTYPDKTVHLEIWQVLKFVGEPVGKENQTLRWAVVSELQSLPLLAGNRRMLDRIAGHIQQTTY